MFSTLPNWHPFLFSMNRTRERRLYLPGRASKSYENHQSVRVREPSHTTSPLYCRHGTDRGARPNACAIPRISCVSSLSNVTQRAGVHRRPHPFRVSPLKSDPIRPTRPVLRCSLELACRSKDRSQGYGVPLESAGTTRALIYVLGSA